MPRSGAYWQHSFESSDKLRDRERSQEGGESCGRGDYCSARRTVVENGERVIIPGRAYGGGLCPSCRSLVASCLAELPPAYLRLAAEIPQMHRRGVAGHSPFGPRLPFDATYQELMARIAETLLSFEERVRTVARLSVMDTQASRHRNQYAAVRDAARLLGHDTYLSALLALPLEPMMRSVPARSDPDRIELVDLDGAAAADEILSLHRRALLVLGEIVRQREHLDGVPCKRCEQFSLQRAEPPSDPAAEAMWSECADCRHTMSKLHFDAWVKWYGGWADRRGLECRRCVAGRHGECEYGGCACGAGRHGDIPDTDVA